MARPRTFEEDDVIQKAMNAFWKNGFETTSIGMLESATGISRISIYNTFGDKSGLFLKALEKYSADTHEYFTSEAFRSGGLKSIISLFENSSKPREEDALQNYGCLMLNTILDVEAAGPNAREIVAETRNDMIKGFKVAMKSAIASGNMIPVKPEELTDRSEFLVGALWGGRIIARLNHDVSAAKGVTRTTIAVVKSWT